MIIKVAGALSLAAWLYLLVGRGGFWRMHRGAGFSQRRASARRGGANPLACQPPSVVAVIPARNEAPVVRRAVASLAAQQFAGRFHIVLVDDASDDGTADTARAAAPAEMLTVLRGSPLPDGWTGKLWAVSQGIAQAKSLPPDYFLLTDADIVHAPGGLERLVAQAEQGGYDLVSWMVALHCESPAERALIPAFVFFFLLLYPPSWISNPRLRTAGAAGGCLLIRRRTFERIGGIACIRGELIDDCALARVVKDAGGRVWLGLSAETRSIREYRSFREIGAMISRTAFTQLRHSPLLLLATMAGLALIFFAPPLAAIRGNPAGLAAWALMTLIYAPALRLYRRSFLWAPLLPLVAAFYAAATVHSAWAWWRGAGGMWKGRVAPMWCPRSSALSRQGALQPVCLKTGARYTQNKMPRWLNVANLLTALRLVLVPFVILAIVGGNHIRALALFAGAALTDALDGIAARELGSTTRLGAYLDPIADKCLLSGVFLALAVAHLAPRWLVALVFGRDLYILAAVAFLLWLTPVRRFPPSVWGKVSTFVQVLTVTVWLSRNAIPLSVLELLSDAIQWPCAAFTVWSGIHYTWRGLRLARVD